MIDRLRGLAVALIVGAAFSAGAQAAENTLPSGPVCGPTNGSLMVLLRCPEEAWITRVLRNRPALFDVAVCIDTLSRLTGVDPDTLKVAFAGVHFSGGPARSYFQAPDGSGFSVMHSRFVNGDSTRIEVATFAHADTTRLDTRVQTILLPSELLLVQLYVAGAQHVLAVRTLGAAAADSARMTDAQRHFTNGLLARNLRDMPGIVPLTPRSAESRARD